jgi:hypothetical protein
MQSDDTILPSIPPFLRRFEESPPRKLPVRPRNLPAARGQPAQASKPTAAQAPPAAAPAPSAKPKVVDMTPPPAAEGPAAQRGRIALAFENQDLPEGADGGAAGGATGGDSEDIAFELNLPRGVVRQLRIMAAEKDTTQRAVVLRALRLAGLSVPETSDVDHREPSAERQIQA